MPSSGRVDTKKALPTKIKLFSGEKYNKSNNLYKGIQINSLVPSEIKNVHRLSSFKENVKNMY